MSHSFSALPHELLCHVLEHAGGLRTLYAASRVCRTWRAAAEEQRRSLPSLRLLSSHGCSSGKIRFPHAMSLLPRHVGASGSTDDVGALDNLIICEQGCPRARLPHIRIVSVPASAPPISSCSTEQHTATPTSAAVPTPSSSSTTLHTIAPLIKDLPLVRRGSSGPSGLAVHAPSSGSPVSLFVSDHGLDTITESTLSSLSSHRREHRRGRVVGGFGTDPGCLIGPCDLCIADDYLFIAESHGISAFDVNTLACAHKWGRVGRGVGEFKSVAGLAAKAGELYACDTGNCRIQVFGTSDGRFLRAFGKKGDAPGQFRKPVAVIVVGGMAAAGSATTVSAGRELTRVIVAESTGRRVQVLGYSGAPLQLISSLAAPLQTPAQLVADDDEEEDEEEEEAAEAFAAPVHRQEVFSGHWRGRARLGDRPSARIGCFAVDEARGRLYAMGATGNACLHIFELLPTRVPKM